MRERKPPSSVLQMKPTPGRLAASVRKIAQDSGLVSFGDHALERMDERGITRLDALRVLRGGEISGEIEAGRSAGEWKCKMTMRLRGSREAGVVTVVSDNRRLFVKTAEWEDK